MTMQYVYFIGIGGSGMSQLAIATALFPRYAVSGSDQKDGAYISSIKSQAPTINIHIGQSQSTCAARIQEHMTIVVSTAISPENHELAYAESIGCEIVHRSEWLSRLAAGQSCLSVMGSHGKTTVSGAIAYVRGRLDVPVCPVVGGIYAAAVPYQFHLADTGQTTLVIEADESDGSFRCYTPRTIVVTNLEEEHVDFWKNGFAELRAAVREHVTQKSVKHLILSLDPSLDFLADIDDVIRYGEGTAEGSVQSGNYGFKISDRGPSGMTLSLSTPDGRDFSMTTALLGRHNAENLCGAFAALVESGLDPERVTTFLGQYPGMYRRMTFACREDDFVVINDYAHHPTEVAATVESVTNSFTDLPLHIYFQPHRHSRFRFFAEMFASVLLKHRQRISVLYFFDTFAAGEQDTVEDKQMRANFCATLMDAGMRVRRLDLNDVQIEGADNRETGVHLIMGAGDIARLGILKERQG